MKLALPAVLVVAASLALVPVSASARKPAPSQGYIVVYKSSVQDISAETNRRERQKGFRTEFRYRRAIKGFAANLSRRQVEELQQDPEVAFVSADRTVQAIASDPLASGETAPTGIRRMGAATSNEVRRTSGAGVAVIDTGVDLSHPDLNAANGKNCVSSSTSANDDNGHGTHVAGTIAAENTGVGVVGVSPGTKVHAVKVLDSRGSGSWSQVICGIDWVTATRSDSDPDNDVAVANMSLGGAGTTVKSCATTTDALHKAICRSTDAGVNYVVAAGNSGWDFDYATAPDVPAAYPQVLTVTALSDSDGQPGASGGAPSCRTSEADDRYASFSNYAATSAGRDHTIAGPGVCINSTWPGGGYRTISGTSMASPHLAGAVALCIDEDGASGVCAGRVPADVIATMRGDADSLNRSHTFYGFTGDPLRPVSGRYFGFLPWAGVAASPPPAPVSVTASPTGVAVLTGSHRTGTAASLSADDNAYYEVASTSSGTRTAAWRASFGGISSQLSDLKVTYKGKNSRSCTQTVAIWNWATSSWVQLDSRSVGTSEVGITVAPGGTLSNYVSSGGELRVRVQCTNSSRTFNSQGDLMRISYKAP